MFTARAQKCILPPAHSYPWPFLPSPLHPSSTSSSSSSCQAQTHLCRTEEKSWRGELLAMDAWTHKPPIGNQVASWWPNSQEDLVAVLVSPPCGLILSVPAPDADWAPFGGGTKSPPPSLSPSVSLCLQHHAPKHSTGKWWEEKLKFANCWEMQREEGVSVSRKSHIFRLKQIFGLHCELIQHGAT